MGEVKQINSAAWWSVLCEKFCKYALENYFGKPRATKGRPDNPNILNRRYNDSTIKAQFCFRSVTVNIQDHGSKWNKISTSSLKKRKSDA